MNSASPHPYTKTKFILTASLRVGCCQLIPGPEFCEAVMCQREPSNGMASPQVNALILPSRQLFAIDLMLRHFLLVCILLWRLVAGGLAVAQPMRKHVLRIAGPTPASAVSKRVFYQLDPATLTARGLLVLLPGFGEPARDMFRATSLAQEAAQRGFVVLVVDINDHICLDSVVTRLLDEVIGQAVRQRPALARRLVLGGFSAGGQLALAYAEVLVRDSTQRPWHPRGMLGVDPPLDLMTHWQRVEYHLARQDCPAFRPYDQHLIKQLTRELGGSPTQLPGVYLARSAFVRTDSVGGNARWLRALPVRLYTEPDLAFWQATCPSQQPEDLNAYGAAALIARLRHQGSTRA